MLTFELPRDSLGTPVILQGGMNGPGPQGPKWTPDRVETHGDAVSIDKTKSHYT